MTDRLPPHAIDTEGNPDGYGLLISGGRFIVGAISADAADVTFTPVGTLAATDVQAALAELDAEKIAQGDKIRQGSRALSTYQGVFLQSYQDTPNHMVIWTQKTESDSTDDNIDGAVLVKHDKGYTGTPGYSDTFQVYSLAGSSGTVIGNNNFVELGPPPYSIPADPTPNGYIRFELGPRWPDSEVVRLNNRGDLIVGWTVRTIDRTYTQSGTTVTQASGANAFTADDVGAYLLWTGTTDGRCDRITGFIDSTHVTVETSRTLSTATEAEVRVPRVVIRHDGTIETAGGFVVKGRPGQTGSLLEVEDSSGTTLLGVAADGTLTGDFPTGGGSASSSGELLMQDGVTGPPVPIETEGRDDWLYEG